VSRTRAPAIRRRRANAAPPTSTVITPPSQMLVRAPKVSASQPTTGAPIGLVPRKTSTYSAITRPRSSASTPSWTRWFAAWAR
jgi:hypothetical protein